MKNCIVKSSMIFLFLSLVFTSLGYSAEGSRPNPPENLRIDEGGNPGNGDDGNPAPGGNAHFDIECGKTGIAFCRSYRTQAEIDQDWYTSGMTIPAGHEDAGFYDPDLDGALLPIRQDTKVGQLRNSFPSVGGDVWMQYEIYIPQGFYDFKFETWSTMKLFRLHNHEKEGCGDKTVMTTTYVGHRDDTFWFRGHCGLDEYRPKSHIPGNRWTRMTYHINFASKRFEAWMTDVESGQDKQLLSVDVPELNSSTKISGVAPTLHSTSRNHHGTGKQPDFFIGYRNIIVSKKPINR